MQIFDLQNMPSYPYAERQKNVFFQGEAFKTRIITLKSGEAIPTCQMDAWVLFYVISGSVQVTINQEVGMLSEGQCLITEPATVAMKSENGVRIMGLQISTR